MLKPGRDGDEYKAPRHRHCLGAAWPIVHLGATLGGRDTELPGVVLPPAVRGSASCESASVLQARRERGEREAAVHGHGGGAYDCIPDTKGSRGVPAPAVCSAVSREPAGMSPASDERRELE